MQCKQHAQAVFDANEKAIEDKAEKDEEDELRKTLAIQGKSDADIMGIVATKRAERELEKEEASPKKGGEKTKDDIYEAPMPPVILFRKIVKVTGTTAFPFVNNDPRNMFMRRIKNRPAHPIYPARQFIMSKGLYDFGPLLIGKDPECRALIADKLLGMNKMKKAKVDREIEDKEKNAYVFTELPKIPLIEKKEGAETTDDKELDDEVKAKLSLDREQEVSDLFLRKHVETFRVTNNSLFPVDAYFCLASSMTAAGNDFKVTAKVGAAKAAIAGKEDAEEISAQFATLAPQKDGLIPFPTGEFPTYPFIISPPTLHLEKEETKEVLVWCFPPSEGAVEDKLVCTVENNPESIVVPLHACGSIPKVEISPESLDFERLMLRQQDSKGLAIKNTTNVPVYWRIANRFVKEGEDEAEGFAAQEDDIPPQYTVEPREGVLAVGASVDLNVLFKASKAALYDFKLKFEVTDTEGFYASKLAKMEQDVPNGEGKKIKHTVPEIPVQEIGVVGECFEVDVGVEFPNEKGLDFGSLRVGESQEQSFDIVNHGKYPLKYELKIKKKSILDMLRIEAEKTEIEPGERRTIKVTCCSSIPKKIVDSPDLHLRIFEAKSGEKVSLLYPRSN
jgi:hypothetical protein